MGVARAKEQRGHACSSLGIIGMANRCVCPISLERAAVVVLLLLLLASSLAIAADVTVSETAEATEGASDVPTPHISRAGEDSANPNGRPWWIGDLLTLVAVVVGALMIVYQLGRQHSSEMALQKENFREQLRLQVYQEFSPALQDASQKTISATSYASRILANVTLYRQLLQSGVNPAPIKERAAHFGKLHFEANYSIIDLIRLFEKYEILSPDLDIFKTALNAAIHDVTETYWPLNSLLLIILPVDVAGDDGTVQTVNNVQPNDERLKELETTVSGYKDARGDLGAYLYDLNVELQNIFLSKLFGNRVASRKPLDPNAKVISIDPRRVKELRKYFEEETDWGRQRKETDTELRGRFSHH